MKEASKYIVKIIPTHSVVVMYICFLQNLYIFIYTAAVDEQNINAEKFTFNRHLGNILMSFDSSLQRLLPFLRLSKHFSTTLEHIIVSLL